MQATPPREPVFIVGTERSGSNLLRLMLNAHPHVAVPHPPHVMHHLAPLEASYGDLTADANLGRLVDDVLRLVRFHIHPWELSLDRGRLLAEAWPRDLLGVFLGLYEQACEAAGKSRWGCKSTFMIHHVDRVLAHVPDARFLWLVRDPRDVAASSRRSVFNPFHPALTAELWRAQQALGLSLEQQLPADRWLRVRYEDLLAEPGTWVRRVCQLLGEGYDPGMLEFHRTAEARRAAALSEDWRNTASPVLVHNAGKYRRELSPGEIGEVESICGPLMETLGYALDGPRPPSPATPGARRRLAHRWMDARWRAEVEWRSLRRDRNHWRRWSRDGLVHWLRWRGRLRGMAGQ